MVLDLSDAAGIFISALGGAAVGLEREWSGHASGPNARFAGIAGRLNGKGHRRSIARCNSCYGHRCRGSLQYTVETRNRNDHGSEAVSQCCCHWVVCRCRRVRTVTSLAALRSLHQGPRTRAGYRPANARVRNVVLPAET